MKREWLMMFKEALGSLDTASGHSLLKRPRSQREGSISSCVAVHTTVPLQGPLGAQRIKTQVPCYVKEHEGEPGLCQMQNYLVISFPPPSEDNSKCRRLKFNLGIFFFYSKLSLRGIMAEAHKRQQRAYRNYGELLSYQSYGRDRRCPGVPPVWKKTDRAPHLWGHQQSTLQRNRVILSMSLSIHSLTHMQRNT